MFYFFPRIETVSLLMTVVGGVASVAALLLLSICIILYVKCKKKNKLPPADVISEHQISSKQFSKQGEAGDRTSNYSDLKVDISAGYVPYADYQSHYSPPPQYLTTIAPNKQSQHHHHQQQQHHNSLVATLPMTFLNGGGSLTGSIIGSRDIRQDNGLPPSNGGSIISSSPNGSCSNNSGSLVPSSVGGSNNSNSNSTPMPMPQITIDPRYSAIYGNPYLRNSNSSLLPPPTAV